jgi:prolyl-tRNA synthetase
MRKNRKKQIMKFTQLFTKTLKSYPSDETSRNAQLLISAGYINKTMPGVYAMLPLGMRTIRNIEGVVSKHMNEVGGQEVVMSNLQPKEWWVQVDNRWDKVDVLFHVPSQTGVEYALNQSNEEQVSIIAKQYINSYKDLPEAKEGVSPLAIYQIQTKFRDEVRAKAGLMRGREFRMKDMYDFHTTTTSQDYYYNLVHDKYLEIYKELGLDAYSTRASGGSFAKFSHEFQVVTEAGEDWTVIWSNGIRENLEISKGCPTDTNKISRGEMKLRQNLTDEVKSAQNHADHAGATTKEILKTVMFTSKDASEKIIGYIGVSIRGDLNINEELLLQALEGSKYQGFELKEATPEELEALGTKRGRTTSILEICKDYSQEIGGVYWLFDKSLEGACSMIASLYESVDVDRDCIKPSKYAPLAEVKIGFKALDDDASGKLVEIEVVDIKRSAEVGNIFKLGDKWSKEEAMNIIYTNEDNQIKRPLMSCYGIGTTRCMGVLAEVSSDEKGLKWPKSIAPFQVHLVTYYGNKEEQGTIEAINELAQKFYDGILRITNKNGKLRILDINNMEQLKDYVLSDVIAEKQEVIWDNRAGGKVGFGEKLTDADLMGMPYQVIITKRTIDSKEVEVKIRDTGEKVMLRLF